MDNQDLYWIWLTQRPRLGARGIWQLLREFGSPEELYAADDAALERAGVTPTQRKALADKSLGPARAVLERCEASGVGVLTGADPAYPARLRLQGDAPAVLYCKGTPPGEDRPMIGLVGARAADAEGLALAFRLGAEIAACGGLTVTGMAKGVDAQSAEGALANGGFVIGVLGCGPDLVYPRENAALFARVAERGCLLSEYPPGVGANARHFPVRNRLISALSDGVVVVRAAEQSGSLITARWAAEQGRDVFAVPGDPADPLSRGCNALLRDGAWAASSGWDVLERYQFRYPKAVRRQAASCVAGREATGSRQQETGDGGREAAGNRQQATGDGGREATGNRQQATGNGGRGSFGSAALRAGRQDRDANAVGAAIGRPQEAQAVRTDFSDLSPVQRTIAEALADGALQLDALIDKTGLSAAQVLPQLTILQIKKRITQKPGKIYELS